MMTIFIFQLRDQGMFGKSRFSTTSCYGSLPALKKSRRDYWDISCDGNTLRLNVDYYHSEFIGQLDQMNERDQVRSFIYKDLANTLTHITKSAPADLFERIDIIRVHLKFPQGKLNVISEGKDLVPLRSMRNPDHIASLLRDRVQVQENWSQ